jgi:lipid A 3-O-deacylase
VFCALTAVVASAPWAPAARAGVVDEIKAGVLAHDVGFLGDPVEGGADVVGEVLFKSPAFLSAIGAPRPTLGVSANTEGKTDYAYADLTWTATIWHPAAESEDGLYLGGFLGGAVHDGRLEASSAGNKDLGTRALFHLGIEIGYQITPACSVEAYLSHLSNADISSRNPGLNNVGLRTGFSF